MNRILVWHHEGAIGNNERIGPTYYMDADYEPLAVRLHAETAPGREAEFDIFDDGVSIFENRKSTKINTTTGVRTVVSDKTTAVLGEDESSSDIAGNLLESTIEEGSWVHCNLVDTGDGKNFTVQLELRRLHGDDEPL